MYDPPPIPPPHNVASVAMAVSPLRSALSQRGLWIESLAAWVHKEGLESLDDLRCFFRTVEDVEAAGVPLLPVAWEFATAQGPTDWSVRVLDARRQTAAEVTRLGRPLASWPGRHYHSQRAKRPRKQAKVIDPESDLAVRRVAAAAAV